MLSKKERIKKKKEFEYVFRKGKNFNNAFFIVKVVENKISFSRFAFVAPLKSFKKAVDKNKIKRLMREGVKNIYPLIKKGFDIMIIAKEKSKECNFKEIEENIKDVLSRAKLI